MCFAPSFCLITPPPVFDSCAPCGLEILPLKEDTIETKKLRGEDRRQPRLQATEGPEMAAVWEKPRVSALFPLVQYVQTGPCASSTLLFLFILDQSDSNLWLSVQQAAWLALVTPKFLFPLPFPGQI